MTEGTAPSAPDARFHDGGERPLRLWATDAEDLQIISALCQDAILPASELRYLAKQRRFALLLNRFRWEHGVRQPERVQSVLTLSDVTSVRSQGVMAGDADTVLSLMSLTWTSQEDGQGSLILTFAGDGAIETNCECLDVTLRDVTRPYAAPSGQAPDHPT